MSNSAVQVFNYKEHKVRTMEIDGDIWFVAKDVCDVLELKNSRDAVKMLDEDELMSEILTSGGQKREMNVISEAGLYTLLLRTSKEQAKPFRRWVTHEVLPTIRKTGSYMTGQSSYMIEDSIERAQAWIKEEQERRALKSENKELAEIMAVKDQQIAELQPKASYYDVVLQCPDALPISIIAKDYGWSAKKMNTWLKKQRVQFKAKETWILYQPHAGHGYTKTKTHIHTDKNNFQHTSVHTYWTQAGRLFIYELMKKAGNLPLIEN